MTSQATSLALYFATVLVSASAVPSREVVFWLDARSASNATWASWAEEMSSHRANVTGAAPLAYQISPAGTFGTAIPNASAVAIADGWMQYMRTEVALRIKPLVFASADGIARAIADPTVGSALISSSALEAQRLGITAFDLQLDVAGPAGLRGPWLAFLAAWLGSLDAVGAQLGLLIPGNCSAGQPDEWFGASCADLRALALNVTAPHPNLRVISEASFGDASPADWTAGINAAEHGLGPSVLSLGVTYDAPLLDQGNGCLMYALAGGLTSLYVKEGLPAPGPAGAEAWTAFGYWMTTIA